MALIKYGGGVASMAGKQGGSVHARNRAGAYIRNWAKPTGGPTAIQTVRRTTFAAQSAGWQTITQDQRDAWDTWANRLTMLNRQGDEYVPTGRQMYMSCNNNLALIGAANIEDPPTSGVPPTINPDTGITATESGGIANRLRMDDGFVADQEFWLVYSTPIQTGGKNNLNTQFRAIGVFTPAENVPILDEYSMIFGIDWPFKSRLQVKYRTINNLTGLSSPWLVILAGVLEG